MKSLQCNKCKNYLGAASCLAFFDGIPSEIMNGKFDHTKPYKGDNGIRFEEIKDADEQKDNQ